MHLEMPVENRGCCVDVASTLKTYGYCIFRRYAILTVISSILLHLIFISAIVLYYKRIEVSYVNFFC